MRVQFHLSNRTRVHFDIIHTIHFIHISSFFNLPSNTQSHKLSYTYLLATLTRFNAQYVILRPSTLYLWIIRHDKWI